MTKKKVSGQTIAIIVLAIILLLTVAFGGVYAYYSTSTNKVSGKIVMATLSIDYKYDDPDTPEVEGVKGDSGESQILITNVTEVVPNEILENTPLIVTNGSTAPIYLVVFYSVIAENRLTRIPVVDVKTDGKKVIDVGADTSGSEWADYVFMSDKSGSINIMRCLVTIIPQNKSEITVIGSNGLKLHKDMNNDYQNCDICFTFHAYAIGSSGFQFSDTTTNAEKCEQIVSAIYEAYEYKITI